MPPGSRVIHERQLPNTCAGASGKQKGAKTKMEAPHMVAPVTNQVILCMDQTVDEGVAPPRLMLIVSPLLT